MAYSLEDRFPRRRPCYRLEDPGAYVSNKSRYIKPNKVAFLSRAPRHTMADMRLWTTAVYETSIPSNIVNCTAFLSKTKRFPYEAFSKEDLEEMLCRCGLPCECPVEEKPEDDFICQAKVRRRVFKGAPPHSLLGEGISAPSKRHRGYEIFPDGSIKQMLDEVVAECPPFYDARVHEATAFYHGWKWSQWRSERAMKSLELRPGPADYTIKKEPTKAEICAEQFRAERRKYSKQLRYIELVQNRNIAEGRPGPADYDPKQAKGTDVPYYGPKAERFFTAEHEMRPGPADYSPKRDFDLPEAPERPCHAKIPEPAGFGVKAPRFRASRVEGPGPANYSPSTKLCRFLHCQAAPFNCSAARFKENIIEDDDDDDETLEGEETEPTKCPEYTWGFKSKTIRMKPLVKKMDEPSPADLSQSRSVNERSPQLQYIAPFNSSEGRFQPWYDWLPVFGKSGTPGPCYYNLERPKCQPAVHHGPLYRSLRFPESRWQTPAPNEYKVGGGVETVLATHNKRLKKNIRNKRKHHWNPPLQPRNLSYEEQEMLLFKKTIELLEYTESDSVQAPAAVHPTEPVNAALESEKSPLETAEESHVIRHSASAPSKAASVPPEPVKEKMLRSFLYRKPMPHYF